MPFGGHLLPVQTACAQETNPASVPPAVADTLGLADAVACLLCGIRVGPGKIPSHECLAAYGGLLQKYSAGNVAVFACLWRLRRGGPPTLLVAGTRDFFLSNCVRLSRKMRLAGTRVELRVWEEVFHGFDLIPDLPEGIQARAEMAEFLVHELTQCLRAPAGAFWMRSDVHVLSCNQESGQSGRADGQQPQGLCLGLVPHKKKSGISLVSSRRPLSFDLQNSPRGVVVLQVGFVFRFPVAVSFS